MKPGEIMSEQRDDLIGKTLGQYEILEEVGRGGMATVYKARQLSINRTVAVKVLPRHFLHDPGFFERFEREVDVIAHLEHPHILPIYDYGKADDMPYIAMRFLGGGSMAQVVRRGISQLDMLDRPFTQVAQALDHAHRQGIIHRDLKPGNIMLDEEGNAYLSDFGIARVLGSNLTGSMIIGTPAYMSPEQANGLPLDARSDLYSLGIVLFELITGREPFQAETPMALLLKHLNEPVPPLSSFRPDIPDAVELVIMKATAKDPNARYTSASEMAKAFSDALHDPRKSTRVPSSVQYEDAPTILPDTGSRGIPRPTPYTGQQTVPPGTPYPQQGTPYPQQGTPYPQQPTPYPQQGTPYPTPYPQQPTPYPYGQPPPTGPYPPMPARSRTPMIIGGVVVLIALVVAAVAIIPGLTPKEAPVTLIPSTLAPPTPFQRGQRVDTSDYTLSIPRDWIPPQGFYDISESDRLIHVWQPSDLSAYIAVIIPNYITINGSDNFAQTVEEYTQRFYVDNPRSENLELISESTAPDGTIRQSYRMFGPMEPQHPPGQLDVFYLNRAPYLTVLEMFSADATGNTLVPTFQQILDSLQVKIG